MCAELGALGSRKMEKRTWDMVITSRVVIPSRGEWGPMHIPWPTQLGLSLPSLLCRGFGSFWVSPQQSLAAMLHSQPTFSCLYPLSF